MKRIIFCFDGTWNRADSDHPTNVLLTASSVTPKTIDGVTQLIHYDTGVGTEKANEKRGGMFGRGLFENIEQAYLFLIFNYSPGDEIFVFGFSRGAFTARSFVGFVKSIGIIQRDRVKMIGQAIKLYKNRLKVGSLELLDFRSTNSRHITVCPDDEEHRCKNLPDYVAGEAFPFQFKYVGIWDTVESLGFWKIVKTSLSRQRKKRFVAKEYRFHDHEVSEIIASGRHAIALDEFRKTFDVEPWGDIKAVNGKMGYKEDDEESPIKEMFFPGDHGSVGGGGPERGLSDAALEWVLDGAKSNGLVLDVSPTSVVFQTKPDFTAPLSNNPNAARGVMSKVMNIGARARSFEPEKISQLHTFVKKKWSFKSDLLYRPSNLKQLEITLNELPETKPIERAFEAGKIEYKPNKTEAFYHVVKKGESLSVIAKLYSGDKMRYPEIFQANKDFIEDENKIYIGQVIKIPKSLQVLKK